MDIKTMPSHNSSTGSNTVPRLSSILNSVVDPITLMRILIRHITHMLIRIRILFDADANPDSDPTFLPDADPDSDPSFRIRIRIRNTDI
jgi:hypothetical protein